MILPDVVTVTPDGIVGRGAGTVIAVFSNIGSVSSSVAYFFTNTSLVVLICLLLRQ